MSRLVRQGLVNTDQRVAAGKPVTPDVPVRAAAVRAVRRDHREAAAGEVARHRHHRRCRGPRGAQAQGRISIPKRFSLGVREMFAAQPRLEQPRGRRALRMLEQPRFRAGFDLLLLRADMGLASRELADWWTKVQEVSQTDRDRMADALAPQQRPAGDGGAGAPWPAPSPSAWAGPRTRGLMNAATAEVASASSSLVAGLCRRGQQPRGSARAGGARTRGARPAAAAAASSLVRRCIARSRSVRWCSRPSSMRWPGCSRSRRRKTCWPRCARSSANSAASRRASAGVRGSSTSTCWWWGARSAPPKR